MLYASKCRCILRGAKQIGRLETLLWVTHTLRIGYTNVIRLSCRARRACTHRCSVFLLQNAAARLIMNLAVRHVIRALRHLHWLPVHYRLIQLHRTALSCRHDLIETMTTEEYASSSNY